MGQKEIKFEDLKIGQHAWAIYDDMVLMVAKLDPNRLDVCGPWECGISPEECKIIKLVNLPRIYRNLPFYY